jgi:Uma2 family endonuclease
MAKLETSELVPIPPILIIDSKKNVLDWLSDSSEYAALYLEYYNVPDYLFKPGDRDLKDDGLLILDSRGREVRLSAYRGELISASLTDAKPSKENLVLLANLGMNMNIDGRPG